MIIEGERIVASFVLRSATHHPTDGRRPSRSTRDQNLNWRIFQESYSVNRLNGWICMLVDTMHHFTSGRFVMILFIFPVVLQDNVLLKLHTVEIGCIINICFHNIHLDRYHDKRAMIIVKQERWRFRTSHCKMAEILNGRGRLEYWRLKPELISKLSFRTFVSYQIGVFPNIKCQVK